MDSQIESIEVVVQKAVMMPNNCDPITQSHRKCQDTKENVVTWKFVPDGKSFGSNFIEAPGL